MLTIWPIPALYDNYIWTIMHPVKRLCAIVDPGEAAPVLNALLDNELTLTGILITHHHHDHTDGIAEILENHPVTVFAPHSSRIPETTHPLKEGEVAEISELGLCYKVIETPAHTREHISYYGNGALFSGDTLFTAGCGRLFEGSAQQMCDSLTKLTALPNNTLVYCGHEYTENNLRFAQTVEPDNTAIQKRLIDVEQRRANYEPTVPATLEIEKQTNPFLRCHTAGIKASAEKHAGITLDTPVDVFAEIRRWKDTWSASSLPR